MSTRGIIGKRVGENEWYGVYHHFDSYPSGLGNCLVEMFVTEFNMNHELMADYLIEQHPMGWSTLMGQSGRKCYCHTNSPAPQDSLHGYSSVKSDWIAGYHKTDIRTQNTENWDIEYLYLFGENGIEVYQGNSLYGERLMLIPYNKADMFIEHAILADAVDGLV